MEEKRKNKLEEYVNLLIIQYQTDKNRALVREILRPFVNLMVLDFDDYFDIPKSTGAHLDMLGLYVYITRSGMTDDEYKTLILFKILVLHLNSHSFIDIEEGFFAFFGDAILVEPNLDSGKLYYNINTDLIPLATINLLKDNNLFPIPIGTKGVVIRLVTNDKIFFQPLLSGQTQWNDKYESNWKVGAEEAPYFLTQDDVIVL